MLKRTLSLFTLFAVGCGGQMPGDAANPFLQDQSNEGKVDTAYQNPDGIEVEVDLEADVTAPAWSLADAPAVLGQFAMTYLRKKGDFYLESLAEDASSDQRVEWRVDGAWITAAEAKNVDKAKLKHFRLRGVNAVLLHQAREGAAVGKVYTAKVPTKPYTIMSDAGETCGEAGGHIGLSQSVYWYLWEADKEGCKAETQEMTLTLSKLLPKGDATYLEYDRLIADKKITAVILFGQIGDDLTEYDPGVTGAKRMATWLKQAGFKDAPAPVGVRLSKKVKDITVEIDLYSPYEFSGLSDFAHFGNFEKAIAEHEIVTYDGHSMLGASDYFARPAYPDYYQVFLYGGCLGYEYYVRPILEKKGGWKNVDVLSSVIEVSASANEYAGPFLAKLLWALEHNYNVSWQDMIAAIRTRVGDSTFGVSGARDNCFTPTGSRCP